jgi:hypothetical protein
MHLKPVKKTGNNACVKRAAHAEDLERVSVEKLKLWKKVLAMLNDFLHV